MNLKNNLKNAINKVNLNKLAVIFLSFHIIMAGFIVALPKANSIEDSSIAGDVNNNLISQDGAGDKVFFDESSDANDGPLADRDASVIGPKLDFSTEEEPKYTEEVPDIPDQSITEDDTFNTINLGKSSDANNEPPADSNDVPPSPVTPVVIDVLNQSITKDTSINTINLDDYESEIDHTIDDLKLDYSDNMKNENMDQPIPQPLDGSRDEIWINVTKEIYPIVIHPCEPATIAINVTAEGDSPIITTPVAVMLVIDVSGSMNWEYENETGVMHPALDYIKTAANTFIDQMDLANDTIGVASFARYGSLVQPLTHNGNDAKDAVNGLTANGATNTGEGIRIAQQELLENCPPDATPLILLFTDGLPTARRPQGISCNNNCPTENNSCTDYAREQAYIAKEDNTTIFSIGFTGSILFGCDYESVVFAEWLLKDIASSEDYYYAAPNATDLEEIYLNISQTIYDIAISDLIVSDYLPSHFIIVNDGGGEHSILPDGTHKMVFTRPFLALNDSWNIDFEITTLELGDSLLTNLAISNLTYTEIDTIRTEFLPYPRYITVTSPLDIEKNGPTWINPEEQFNYSIEITNIGHMILDNVTISDSLSDKVTFNSIDSTYSEFSDEHWDYINHILNISKIPLDVGTTLSFNISVTALFGSSGDIINTAYGGYRTSNGCTIIDICNSSITTHINYPPVVGDIPY